MPFRSLLKRQKPVPTFPPPAGTLPSDLDPGARKRWFETFALPVSREARAALIALGAMAVAALEGIALTELIPLKKEVPYVAEFADDGTLKPDERFRLITAENTHDRQRDYFVKLWLRWLFTIDDNMLTTTPKTAYYVRGDAVSELTTFINVVDRAAARKTSDPKISRELARATVSPGPKDSRVLFVHVELIERSAGMETARIKKLMQFQYDFLPDMVAEENPLGLTFVHFTVADE